MPIKRTARRKTGTKGATRTRAKKTSAGDRSWRAIAPRVSMLFTDDLAGACEIVVSMKVDDGLVDLTDRYAGISSGADGPVHRLPFHGDTARAHVDPGEYLITWAVRGVNDSVLWTLAVTGDVRSPVSEHKRLYHGHDGGEFPITAEAL